MKKIVLFSAFIFLFSGIGFAQFFDIHKKKFLYGKMVNSKKELAGYFWFDNNNITSNGQTVYYKKSIESNDYKTFQSRKYDYFISDSIYLETFPAIPYLGDYLLVMIPRIIDGNIQLFGLTYTKNSFYFVNSVKDYYFLKNGTVKMRISKKKFNEQMKDLICNDLLLIYKINSGELTYDNLPEIIQSYNQNNN